MPGMKRYAVDVNFLTRSSRILEDTVGIPCSRREGTLNDLIYFLREKMEFHKHCQCSYCSSPPTTSASPSPSPSSSSSSSSCCCRSQGRSNNNNNSTTNSHTGPSACTSTSASSEKNTSSSCTTKSNRSSLSLCHVDFGNSVVTIRLSSTCYPFGKKDMDVIQFFDVTMTGTINDRIGLILSACPEYLLFQGIPEFVIPLNVPRVSYHQTSSALLDSLQCLAITQTKATPTVMKFIGQLLEASSNNKNSSLNRLILSSLTKDPFMNDVDLYAPIAKGLAAMNNNNNFCTYNYNDYSNNDNNNHNIFATTSTNCKCSSLEHLQLEDLELSDAALSMILLSATTSTRQHDRSRYFNHNLKTLDLRRNKAGPCTMHAIATILVGNKNNNSNNDDGNNTVGIDTNDYNQNDLSSSCSLSEISLREQLVPLDLSLLAGALQKGNSSLSTLIVSGNQLKDSGMKMVMSSLCSRHGGRGAGNSNNLRILRMDNCSMIHDIATGTTTGTTPLTAPAIVNHTNGGGAADNSSLWTGDTFHALASGLHSMNHLSVLDISGAIIPCENVFCLLSLGLRYNSSLTQLWARNLRLPGNNPGVANCMNVLFESLQYNSTLELLDLSQNNLACSSALTSTSSSCGCCSLMDVLCHSLSINYTLKSLSLEECHISSNGLLRLARNLPKFRGLRELIIDRNELDRATLRELVKGIQENHILTKLAIGHTVVDDDGNFNVWTKRYDQYGRRYPNEYEEILFHLKLNRRWRELLKYSVPVAVWPKLLESEWDPSIVYTLLREKILLCQ